MVIHILIGILIGIPIGVAMMCLNAIRNRWDPDD